MTYNGWISIDKPVGMTSFDVIRKVRRLFPKTKIGHAGTLDPLACGVLPLALGQATKFISYMQNQTKEYSFEICWGQQTSTDDDEGEVIHQSEIIPNPEHIEGILPEFIGVIDQVPPLFSALKVDGKRACDRMRAGEKVTLASRPVHIDSLKLISHGQNHSLFHVQCHKGTYVRSLARDIGLRLNTYAHARHITRQRVGYFEKNNAFSLERLALYAEKGLLKDSVICIFDGLDDILAIELGETEAQKLSLGQAIQAVEEPQKQHDAQLIIGRYRSDLLVILEWHDGLLHPKKVMKLT